MRLGPEARPCRGRDAHERRHSHSFDLRHSGRDHAGHSGLRERVNLLAARAPVAPRGGAASALSSDGVGAKARRLFSVISAQNRRISGCLGGECFDSFHLRVPRLRQAISENSASDAEGREVSAPHPLLNAAATKELSASRRRRVAIPRLPRRKSSSIVALIAAKSRSVTIRITGSPFCSLVARHGSKAAHHLAERFRTKSITPGSRKRPAAPASVRTWASHSSPTS